MEDGAALELRMLEGWMREALAEAQRAGDAGEVPVGAIVVCNREIVGRGFNAPIASADPTAHAEISAVRQAARRLGNYRLNGCVVISTIEPCAMCVGALIHARVAALVYGAPEPKAGAILSAMRLLEHPRLNHRFPVIAGVLEAECRSVLENFFRSRRDRPDFTPAAPPPMK